MIYAHTLLPIYLQGTYYVLTRYLLCIYYVLNDILEV